MDPGVSASRVHVIALVRGMGVWWGMVPVGWKTFGICMLKP